MLRELLKSIVRELGLLDDPHSTSTSSSRSTAAAAGRSDWLWYAPAWLNFPHAALHTRRCTP